MLDFDNFYKTKFGKFKAYAFTLVRKMDVAEDITQESFIKLNDNFHLIENGKYEQWLRAVVKNTSMDFLRSGYYKREVFFDDGRYHTALKTPDTFNISDMLISLEDIEEEKIYYEKAMVCVNNLPKGYRDVFIRHVIENKTHQEIADELGIVAGTSKSNYHRAKKYLIKELKNDKI